MATAQRAAPTLPIQQPTQSRMTLANVVRGKQDRPRRILLYGVEGVGKSTFAASADSPIFLGPEDGTAQLDVARFPEPKTWGEVTEALDTLRTAEHDYRHLVVDTLDWLEPLCWAFICARDKEESIESYGYGKGYVAALQEWRLFVEQLERLRAERGMHLILLAHSWIKPFKNPEGEDYDRYEMKLHPKAGGFLREWCDVVLFANHETYAHEDRKKRVRGVSTGARLMHTERCAAFDAKNRYNLPPTLPLDWQAFVEAVAADRPATLMAIMEQITALLDGASEDLRTRVEAGMAKDPNNAAHLARVLNHLAAVRSTEENGR